RRPRFAERVFTEAERQECAGRPARWASRWAAKEAVRKLFGAGGSAPLPAFRDIEVRSGPGGAPRVTVRGRQPPGVALSLTHQGDVAVAVAVGGTVSETSPEPPAGLRPPVPPGGGPKGTFGPGAVLAG